jgi:transposase-like protein
MAIHRNPEKEQFWRGVLEEHARSDKDIRAFCQEKNVDERLFYAWRRELRTRDVEAPRITGLTVIRDAVEYYRKGVK